MPKVKPVCSKCGSDDVLSDAYAMWDYEAQEWALQNTFDDNAFCGQCDGEAKLTWRVTPWPTPNKNSSKPMRPYTSKPPCSKS